MKNYFESLDLTESLQEDEKWKMVRYRIRPSKGPMKRIGLSKLSTVTDISIAHFSPEGQNGQKDNTLQLITECLNLCSEIHPYSRVHRAFKLGEKVAKILAKDPSAEVLPSTYKTIFVK